MIKNTLILMLIGVSAFGQAIKTKPGAISDTSTYIINKETNSYKLIEPGKAIGHVTLFTDAMQATGEWGTPDKKIAGSGASVLTWYDAHDSTGHSLTIYTGSLATKKYPAENVIKQIRITSPEYKTINDVHTGMSLTEIKTIYKHLPRQWNGKKIYDDARAGIAFEFDEHNKCTAIIVHAPNNLSSVFSKGGGA